MRWNILDDAGNVINTIQGDAPWVAEHYPGAVPAPEFVVVAPAPAPAPGPVQLPTLVITAIESSAPGTTTVRPDLGMVSCVVGTVLTFSAELQFAGQVVPISSAFLMPVTSRDGRERVLMAPMAGGLATVVAPFAESGVWQVTEAEINSDLPPEMHMHFAGIRIFVVLE